MRERTHRPYWSVPSGYSAQGAKKDWVITTSSGSLGAAKKPKKQNRITKAGKMLKKRICNFFIGPPPQHGRAGISAAECRKPRCRSPERRPETGSWHVS